jgi:hypothetical protein
MAISADAVATWLNRPAVDEPPDAGSVQARPRKKRVAAVKASKPDAASDVAANVVSDTPAFPVDLTNDTQLIADLCRFSEGLLDEKYIRRKWKLDNAVWEQMGSDDRFVEKIDDERIRRVRDGSSKREAAQKHVTRAPDVMAGIMNDASALPKHRIDSAKVLDQFAGGGPQGAGAGEHFIIQINLNGDNSSGDDVLRFDKAIAITPNSTDGATPAVITKDTDDGGEEHF